jgi:RNA polymerase sigma factor (sigma-70 family)
VATYHHAIIAGLAHQLKLSPTRLRLRQFDATEHLIEIIRPGKSYPYDFVCHHITGYRPKTATPQKAMSGLSLAEDLVQLIEDLSGASPLPAALMPIACWTTEELAARLKVSTKTICRWRRRGLAGRKLRYADGTIRMAFPENVIRRFVTGHLDLVKRGAAFKQLTAVEKRQIVETARELLAERRMRLHELSQLIAARVGRAVETVRYTLRRHDQSHPDEALFGRDDQPAVPPELAAIYDAVRSGKSLEAVAAAFSRTPEAIAAILTEVRARRLKARAIHYIYNREFELPSADQTILSEVKADTCAEARVVRPPRDLPPYLQELYRQPLLAPEAERAIFRRYNYLKFKADRLRAGIDPLTAGAALLDEAEGLLAEADRVKNDILRANLRLVVSIARRHVGRAPQFFETVSDGNLSLMRAVEKFDYSRGFKFSTYASWAVMRNYARTIPEQLYQSKLVTGAEEVLTNAAARQDAAADGVLDSARQLIARGLAILTERERDVVVRHYGLDDAAGPQTLDQIGRLFGVTKERVRQIERKAMAKLQAALGPGQPEAASI